MKFQHEFWRGHSNKSTFLASTLTQRLRACLIYQHDTRNTIALDQRSHFITKENQLAHAHDCRINWSNQVLYHPEAASLIE